MKLLIALSLAVFTAHAQNAAAVGNAAEFRDPRTGVSFKLAPGWTMDPPVRTGNQTTVRLHDPHSEAFVTLGISPSPADSPLNTRDAIQAAMRGAINARTRARTAMNLPDYHLLENTIEFYAIDGIPAANWQAAYTENGRPMRDTFARVRGVKTTAVFVAHLPAGDLESFRGRFSAIVKTLHIPDEPPANSRKAILAADIPWRPIIWPFWGGKPRAALYIPVRLDGIPGSFTMQLDTGAGSCPILYGDPRELNPSFPVGAIAPGPVTLSGEAAGARFTSSWRVSSSYGKLHPDKDGTIHMGSLCMDFLLNRILLIDFVRQRVAILPEETDIPVDVASQATFLPMSMRQGHPYVPISLNGQLSHDYFYDTGSSLSTLTASRPRWQELTGRTGGERDNQRRTSSSWGKPIQVVGAPLKGDLRIGPAALSNPVIEFVQGWGDNTNLFGNVPFFDRFTVIVDAAGYRFGILSQDAHF